MSSIGTFPFGEPVRVVEQEDRTPKKVFVLGVYASAVHARWLGANGKNRVKALAVASEPYIFWRGEGVDEILERIKVQSGVGNLVPPQDGLNGPSGVALDDLFLHPLGLSREDAWLCDLVPHSCMNPAQKTALEREYLALVEEFGLPVPSVPPVRNQLADDEQRNQILEEVQASQADILISLGDEPIRWFLKNFEPRWKKLSDFGTSPEQYGRLHKFQIEDMEIQVLPLVHPRQAARLGVSSTRWNELHDTWTRHAQSYQ